MGDDLRGVIGLNAFPLAYRSPRLRTMGLSLPIRFTRARCWERKR